MKISEPRTEKFICGHCKNETRHRSVYHGRLNKPPQQRKHTETIYETYDVLECQDCKNLTLCVDKYVHPGPMIGDPYVINKSLYPPASVRVRPSWLNKLNRNVAKLVREIYGALDNSLFSVASTGIRTVLDQMLLDKIGDSGTFKSKLEKMEQNNLIDSDERDILETVVDAGSASAHRGFNPSKKTIGDMLDIVEAMLEKIYVAPMRRVSLQRKAKYIKGTTPPRESTSKPEQNC